MPLSRREQSSSGEERRSLAGYAALRNERDRGLDLVTRQRLHIQRLTAILHLFVEAAEADPPALPGAADLARARALLDERL